MINAIVKPDTTSCLLPSCTRNTLWSNPVGEQVDFIVFREIAMRANASIALLFLAISGSAIALKVPIDNLTDFPKALAAYSQTPASSKTWQNARLVRTLPIMDSSPVLSPTSPILATYRRGEQTRTEGDQTISSQTDEKIITLTNINTGEEIRRITYDSPSEIKSLIFSPDGRLLASHSYSSDQETLMIRVWDVSTGKELQTLRHLVKPKRVEGTSLEYSSGNSAIAFSPDGKSLISIAGGNSTIYIWDLTSKQATVPKKVNRLPLAFTSARNSNLVISPDNRLLASNNTNYDNLEKNRIQVWDLKTGKLVRTIPVKGIITFIRFTSDGKKIINTATSPFSSTQFQIRDANTGKLIAPSQEFGDAKNSTLSIAISPDQKTYAIAGQERQFHVRDLMTGKTIAIFGWEELWVDYTADGKSLVTSGREGIKVWQ